jgi:hypothetical protein
MNKLEFSCFTDFLYVFLKSEWKMVLFKNLPVEWTVNSIEQKIRVFFLQIDVQECHL